MNIQNIKNSTLAKLTAKEIGELGLCNDGIGLYRGNLKARHAKATAKTEDGITYAYDYQAVRFEFTRIDDDGDDRPNWACRVLNKALNKYETYPMGISGCEFFR